MNAGGADSGAEPSMANSRRAIGSLGKVVAAAVLIAVATIGYALLPRRTVDGPLAARQAYERRDWKQAADWARSRLKSDESDTVL